MYLNLMFIIARTETDFQMQNIWRDSCFYVAKIKKVDVFLKGSIDK